MTLLDALAIVASPTSPSAPDAGVLVPLFDDIVAVCRPVITPPLPDAESLRAHDQSIRALEARFAAVLPMRFGTVIEHADALRAALWSSRERIADALLRVEGCVQFTIRVFAEDPIAGEQTDHTLGPGARYLDARRRTLTSRIARATGRLASLESLRREERCELHEAPPLDASVYHLVHREQRIRYEAALSALVDTPDPVRLRPSGPWPTYAFTPGSLA